MMRLAVLLFSLLAALSPAEAFLGFRKAPVDTAPAEQTAKAAPIYEKALKAQQSGRERSALRGYKTIFEKYPASDFSAQALYNTGVIEYERGNWKKSFTAFQSILIRHPDFPRFNELVEYQFRIALAHTERGKTRLFLVIPIRSYGKAVGYFEIVIRNAPFSDLAPLALMNIAMIHQHQGNTAEAIDALDRLINSYPKSLLADDAYLKLAETFADLVQGPMYDQGATREAMSYFEDFLILFSRNEEVARAEQGLAEMEDVYARSKLVIGEYYMKHRRWYEAASIFFNEAITIAPDSPAAQRAREQLARIEEIRASMPPPDENSPERQKERSFIGRMFGRLFS